MKLHPALFIVLFIILDLFLIERILIGSSTVALMDPKGPIALQQRNLIFVMIFLMLFVIVPVFLFAIHVARKYRANNEKADYRPNWDNDHKIQALIWGFPFLIVCIMGVVTWVYAHKLDAHKPIQSTVQPMTVQVVAMRWKWLFIYPEQGIATLNYLTIPNNTPIHFQLTGYEAPMNSFWIPQLGGQIYAMAGMNTQIHLMATEPGVYRGSNAEISGHGFAEMTFPTHVLPDNEFGKWVGAVKQQPNSLTMDEIKKLAVPSQDYKKAEYSSTMPDLYTTIVMNYMAKGSDKTNHTMESEHPMPMTEMRGMEH